MVAVSVGPLLNNDGVGGVDFVPFRHPHDGGIVCRRTVHHHGVAGHVPGTDAQTVRSGRPKEEGTVHPFRGIAQRVNINVLRNVAPDLVFVDGVNIGEGFNNFNRERERHVTVLSPVHPQREVVNAKG